MASKEFIQKLKESVDLVQLIGETVQLRRAGKYFTGLSPFTKEKTPSFFVNPERNNFYCYSTNQGGDAITFLELTKGMSFREALEFLAARAGLELDDKERTPEQIAHDRKAAEEKKLFFKLNRFAARFFQEQLEGPEGAIARDYCAKRAIKPESVLGFALGYAPDSWTALRDYFLKIQAPMISAYDLGLFRTKGGEKPKADGSNLFDTFRNRLIFPIRDPSGEVLGFGGRWLGGAGTDAPKYLNSLESPVYEKERVLYNLDQAKKTIRELEAVVLVEGYMDCLTMVQAGFPNVVANCGTALTRTQAEILRKLAPKVICLYDSDDAGRAATDRAMNLFLESEGFPLLSASLPDGKDPDEFLRSHGDAGSLKMAEILQNSPAALDLWIEKKIAETPKTLQARTEALDKIAGKLSKLRDDLWIQARLPGVAEGLGLALELLTDALRRYRKGFSSSQEKAISGPVPSKIPVRKNPVSREKTKQLQGTSGKRDVGFERRFLSDLLKHPAWISSLRERGPGEVLPHVSDAHIQQAIQMLLLPLQPGESEDERLQKVQDEVREQAQLRNVFAEAMVKLDDELLPKDLEGSLRFLRAERLRKRVTELGEQASAAYQAGDAPTGDARLQEQTEARRQLADLDRRT